MRLSAAIALQGLANGDVEGVVEQIRVLLHRIEPNVDHVGVEIKAVGDDFGGPRLVDTSFADLLREAEQLRRSLLNEFWRRRDRNCMLASLRLGHAISSMSPASIRKAIDVTGKK